MGMNQDIYNESIKHNIFDFSNKKNAIILGEQYNDCKEFPKRSLFKSMLRDNGWDADSIDMDSSYSTSLKIDLAKPIPENMINKYDILFDFGTGEHVRDQTIYWENCHNLVKNGGYRVHALPIPETWPKHCVYRYQVEFFEDLCQKFDYDIKDIKVIGTGVRALAFSYFTTSEKNFSRDVFNECLSSKIEAQHDFFDKEMVQDKQ